MAVVNAVSVADELVTRLSRTKCRILFEAASPLSLAMFRPVLERVQCDPRLEFWFTTSDSLWDADCIFGTAGITERVISANQARWMQWRSASHYPVPSLRNPSRGVSSRAQSSARRT
jgi:hypothetical protein